VRSDVQWSTLLKSCHGNMTVDGKTSPKDDACEPIADLAIARNEAVVICFVILSSEM